MFYIMPSLTRLQRYTFFTFYYTLCLLTLFILSLFLVQIQYDRFALGIINYIDYMTALPHLAASKGGAAATVVWSRRLATCCLSCCFAKILFCSI